MLEQRRNIFTTSDLAVLWGITNKNTLHTTLSRYEARGILKRISKGVYSKKKPTDLHPYELGCSLAGPFSYVSAESVLQEAGIIMQQINKVTLFGQAAKEFELFGTFYLCRYLNIKFLLNRQGISATDHYAKASISRAVADLLHLNPQYYFDNPAGFNQVEVEHLMSELDYR